MWGDKVTSCAVQPEDWGDRAQVPHVDSDDPLREEWVLTVSQVGEDGEATSSSRGAPLLPSLSRLPGAPGLQLSWGSSRVRSQQTLQLRVSVLICFSCYFLRGGKRLHPGPWLRWGRLSQEGPGEAHLSLHVGERSRGCKSRGEQRWGC